MSYELPELTFMGDITVSKKTHHILEDILVTLEDQTRILRAFWENEKEQSPDNWKDISLLIQDVANDLIFQLKNLNIIQES